MALSLGFILVIAVPLILAGGAIPAPGRRTRRAVVGFCALLSSGAGAFWLAEYDTLPLIVLAFAPAYQLELYTFVLNCFRSNHGREMHLSASGIVTDPELKKDARYSTAYFIGALGLPLSLLCILPT